MTHVFYESCRREVDRKGSAKLPELRLEAEVEHGQISAVGHSDTLMVCFTALPLSCVQATKQETSRLPNLFTSSQQFLGCGFSVCLRNSAQVKPVYGGMLQ